MYHHETWIKLKMNYFFLFTCFPAHTVAYTIEHKLCGFEYLNFVSQECSLDKLGISVVYDWSNGPCIHSLHRILENITYVMFQASIKIWMQTKLIFCACSILYVV